MRTMLLRMSFGFLLTAISLVSIPAHAQWYDEEEAPAGEGQILAPFTFKSFDLAPGGQVLSWIAPGQDVTSMTFLVRGGYAFDQVPIYIGMEIPMTYASMDVTGVGSTDEFAMGGLGLQFKARVDPDVRRTSIFTGWSLDVYIPTFMGSVNSQTGKASLAHGAGLLNTLYPGIHINPEAINVVGTFDLVVPGHLMFFQVELSAASYFPVTNLDVRSVEGGFLWGFILGVNIADPIAFLGELKGYTPLGIKDGNNSPLPTYFAASTGLRMRFGPFKPAVWVSFPLNELYRDSWPDVIIGLDLAFWF